MTEETFNKLVQMCLENNGKSETIVRQMEALADAMEENANELNKHRVLQYVPFIGYKFYEAHVFKHLDLKVEYNDLMKKYDVLSGVTKDWLKQILIHWLEVNPQDKEAYEAVKNHFKSGEYYNTFTTKEWQEIDQECAKYARLD